MFPSLVDALLRNWSWGFSDEDVKSLASLCGPAEVSALICELDRLNDADIPQGDGDLEDDYRRLRCRFEDVLVAVGDLAAAPLTEALQSENPKTRLHAASALERIKNARV